MHKYYFAHAGEHHETAAEAAQHASELTISTAAVFWLVLILAPAIVYLILHLLKVKLPNKLLILSLFLIVFSIISYQHPGAYSVIALSVGFGMVLLLTMAGLSTNQ